MEALVMITAKKRTNEKKGESDGNRYIYMGRDYRRED